MEARYVIPYILSWPGNWLVWLILVAAGVLAIRRKGESAFVVALVAWLIALAQVAIGILRGFGQITHPRSNDEVMWAIAVPTVLPFALTLLLSIPVLLLSARSLPEDFFKRWKGSLAGATVAVLDLVVLFFSLYFVFETNTAVALNRMQEGQASVPEIIRHLDDKDDMVRHSAYYRLAQIGPSAGEALPRLKRALEDPMASIRGSAARAIGRITRGDRREWTRLLIPLLGDPSPTVRRSTIDALACFGPDAGGAVPLLIELWKEGDSYGAYYALEDIGKPAVLPLAELLKDPNPKIRCQAAYTLGQIGPDAEAAVPALREALKDEKVRKVAEEALEFITWKN